MINIKEASKIISKYIINPEKEIIYLSDGLNRILGEHIYAPFDMPSFNQSAVDGYAINTNSFIPNKKWTIQGEIKAGDNLSIKESDLTNITYKIFTGAKIPPVFNCIIMKELAETDVKNNKVRFTIDKISEFQNIRKSGEELQKGELVFSAGTILDAEHLTILASLGMKQIQVFRKFNIKIIITGNELKSAEEHAPLKDGEKYESNGIMLKSLLKKHFGIRADMCIVPDNKETLHSIFKESINRYDIIITTGGVSVGDYDFTKDVIQQNGFQILFDKVSQKPGKPFVFATNNANKVIFGLPGNPRAVLSCYYIYILSYLLKCYQTNKNWIFPTIPLQLNTDYVFNDNRSRILFVQIEGDKIIIPPKQDSHMLISSAASNGIIILDKSVKKGDLINVYLLR